MNLVPVLPQRKIKGEPELILDPEAIACHVTVQSYFLHTTQYELVASTEADMLLPVSVVSVLGTVGIVVTLLALPVGGCLAYHKLLAEAL